MKKTLLIFLGTLTTIGCASFGGDMIIRVTGSVPLYSSAKEPSTQCRLDMVSTKTGKREVTRNISPDFSTTMMIVAGPRPETYYFTAECGDGRQFRSNEITVSSSSSYGRSFNLGALGDSVP